MYGQYRLHYGQYPNVLNVKDLTKTPHVCQPLQVEVLDTILTQQLTFLTDLLTIVHNRF